MPAPQPIVCEVIDIRAAGAAAPGSPSNMLARTGTPEVRRLTLARGREIATYEATGEITVRCSGGGSRQTRGR